MSTRTAHGGKKSNKKLIVYYENIKMSTSEIQFVEVNIVPCSGGKCKSQLQKLSDDISECEKNIIKAKERYHEVLILNLKKDAKIRQLEESLENAKFNKYSEILGETTIKLLKSLSSAPEQDSTFILTAMKGLYKDDFARLKTITYSGRKKEKIDVLQNLFTERLDTLPNSVERNGNFSKHVKNAILSINKSASRPAL